MAKVALGKTVTGFVYENGADEELNGSIVTIVARSDEVFMGEPTFVIKFKDGREIDAIGLQLRPWYRVADVSDDFTYFE